MSSSKPFIITAFYTKQTPYRREALKLRKTCVNHSIEHHIVGIENQGDWTKNCAQKPLIILEAMEKFPNHNIVYLDADARVVQYPKLFEDFPADVGVHYLEGKELLSGTIFLRNNQQVFNLIYGWKEMQEMAEVPVWDQKVLQFCLREFADKLGVKVRTLPATYCLIFDTMAGMGKPVIKHMQASRQAKRLEQKEAGLKEGSGLNHTRQVLSYVREEEVLY